MHINNELNQSLKHTTYNTRVFEIHNNAIVSKWKYWNDITLEWHHNGNPIGMAVQ